MTRPLLRVAVLAAAVALVCGCSAPIEPEATHAQPPPAGDTPAAAPNEEAPARTAEGFSRIVAGSGDSTSALPGTVGAQYRYRFGMIQPSGENNAFQDRDLSFYFRPSPASIYFQVENRQNRPVVLDWGRCIFYGPTGRTERAAHSTTQWDQRFSSQSPITISGLQRYGDYVFGMDYLVDPSGSGRQLHRIMFPEDAQAMQFTGRVYGMDLVFLIEDRPRVYSVRFKVESVIPQ
jgi:hypothetical protein